MLSVYVNAQVVADDSLTPSGADKTGGETVTLSPFVVESTSGENTYRADTSLAGSRTRTDLKDIASAISVVTSQFMKDTGATNNLTLLQYTPNTEVSGAYGNFAGVGGTFVEGAAERNFANPGANNRVRGLDSADNTRDYFLTDIPWDSFNVDRVDLQRGPNSILFGIGSPAGIINASVNAASFADAYKFENRVGSFGTVRNSFDLNRVLIPGELAVRVAGLDDDTKYQQDPAFDHDRRIYGAVRWDPQFFGKGSGTTSIRANFERGEVKANRPRVLPPEDLITQFFDPNAFNRTAVDPYFAWEAGLVTGTPIDGQRGNYWIQQQETRAYLGFNGPTATVGSSAGPGGVGAGGASNFGIDSTGAQDGAIGGFPYAAPIGIAGYNYYAITTLQHNPGDPNLQGANSGFFKSWSLTDPTIFDFYNHLIDGPTKQEAQDWNAFNISLEQTFLHNRLGLQLVYDHQKYNESAEATYANALTVDISANTMLAPWPYATSVTQYNGTGVAGTNPNAGRAMLFSNWTTANGSGNYSTREALRFTGFGELRATDLLKHSLLTDILGHHLINGLFSRESYDNESRDWVRYAMDPSWSSLFGNSSVRLPDGARYLDTFAYLSDPLFSATSAHGLNIQPLTTMQDPHGAVSLSYFDSHWNAPLDPNAPGYIDPAAPWTNPALIGSPGVANTASTQSENPANYVGVTNGTFNVLNADHGDINSLYTGGRKVQRITETGGITWQGFLWDDTIVGTYGWRRDKVKTRNGYAQVSDVTGAASMDYDLDPLDPASGVATSESRSWGLVLHEPKFLRGKLPWGSDVSLFYSDGNNTRVEERFGLDGEKLPNAAGHTRDFGVVVNTLDNRLQLKVTWYRTQVSNANLTSLGDTGLGGNAYYAILLDGWATGGALQDLAGIAGAAPGWGYFWNWAANDHGTDVNATNPLTDVAWQNDPITVHEKEAALYWVSHPPPANFLKNFGFPVVNLDAINRGDWAHVTNQTFNPTTDGQWAFVPSTGPATTATVDNESKGIEFEIVGQPTKNLNVSLNASKQRSYQTALGAELVDFITEQYARYQTIGGDLRLWSAGDQTIRDYYNQNIWAAFQFQLQTNGKLVPEMSPWRANLVTNYTFDQGALKGFNAGLGFRWQQGEILGYALNATKDNLDVNKPFWGKSQSAVDLWLGYVHRLSRKLTWNVQLNVRSVGESAHLEAISVQPDGAHALRRIVEGQTWMVTNTFSF
jgi:hypothetical protein